MESEDVKMFLVYMSKVLGVFLVVVIAIVIFLAH